MPADYIGGMETNPTAHGRDAAFDFEIATLLGGADQSASIVDRLMTMPLGDASADEWERAVALRMERKLAARLRELIEPADERRSA